MSDSPSPTEPGGAGEPPARVGRSRWLLAAVAALIPLVPILVVVFALGSGTSHDTATAGTRSGSTASAARATPHRNTLANLLPGHGALVAYLQRPQALRSAPGGRRLATLQTKTSFGSPTSVLVRRVRGRWLGVVSAAAGNNRLGWITLDHVALARSDWTVHVSLTHHALVVDHGSRVMARYVVAVGKPSAPTPTGLFAVTDRLTTGVADGPYGCCILALSAQAPHAISDWDGGNRIAIHSYPITSTLGQSVSHGCIHVTDTEGEWLLKHIPLGTPVVISSA